MRARDEAMRLLNRLTVGAALGAIAGVGIFGAVSAATIPGTSAASPPQIPSGSSSNSSSASTASSSNSSSSWNPFAGLQSSSGVSAAPSGSGMVVSGGSR